MTAPRMRDDYASRVRSELARLVDREGVATTEPRAAVPIRRVVSRWRQVVGAAVALAVVVPAALFALSPTVARVAGTERSAAVQPSVSPGAAGFGPYLYLVQITSTRAVLEDGVQEYGQGRGWFETVDGAPRFVIEIGDRLIRVPLVVEGAGVSSDSTPDTRYENSRCRSDQECMLRAWMARFFQKPVTYTRTTIGFTATAGSDRITGTITKRKHHYPDITPVTIGDRTLLTYPSNPDGAQAAALMSGDLGVNDAGCLVGGDNVLVLPDTAKLNPDGSIDLDGRHHVQGEPLNIAGGQGTAPETTACGQDLDYWYY